MAIAPDRRRRWCILHRGVAGTTVRGSVIIQTDGIDDNPRTAVRSGDGVQSAERGGALFGDGRRVDTLDDGYGPRWGLRTGDATAFGGFGRIDRVHRRFHLTGRVRFDIPSTVRCRLGFWGRILAITFRPIISGNSALLVSVAVGVIEAAIIIGLKPGHDPEPRRLARFGRDAGRRRIAAREGFLHHLGQFRLLELGAGLRPGLAQGGAGNA